MRLIDADALIEKIHIHQKITKEQAVGEIRDDDVKLYLALHIAEEFIKTIPSAEPECNLDEWCHDCKEYDKEKNRCPRWNRVIRTALEEAQPERKKGEWIHDGRDFQHGCDWIHCSVCGRRGINVPADLTNFCPNCGADMRGGEECMKAQ